MSQLRSHIHCNSNLSLVPAFSCSLDSTLSASDHSVSWSCQRVLFFFFLQSATAASKGPRSRGWFRLEIWSAASTASPPCPHILHRSLQANSIATIIFSFVACSRSIVAMVHQRVSPHLAIEQAAAQSCVPRFTLSACRDPILLRHS